MNLANNQCIIDSNCCLSIKSRKEPNIQCTRARKGGSEFCGIHGRMKIISKFSGAPSTILKKREVKEPDLYLKVEHLKDRNGLNYAKIIKSLKHFQVQIDGSRDQLIDLLEGAIKDGSKLIEAKLDPSGKCNNTCDFYDFIELDKIPKEYLFIFMCQDGLMYGMDIRSINSYFKELEKDAELMEKPVDLINPYNRYTLSSKTICQYRDHLQRLISQGKSVIYPDEEHEPGDQMTFKVLEVFHTIYNYGYAVDASWFLEMSREQLLSWYWVMEDIWNRRLGLTSSAKRNIVPGNCQIFNKPEYYRIRSMNKLELQEKMIGLIDQMVNSGTDRDNRILGIIYVLMGITEVCEIDSSLPFSMA